MDKINFNYDWCYSKIGEETKVPCELPHDAMISENRSLNSKGAKNISYFEGYDYEYEKHFEINKDLVNKILVLEFEGVYKDAEIYINSTFVHKENYGYNDFFVDITKFVKLGDNVVIVKCFNADQPNSRWYTGSGIYRNVNLLTFEKEHILLNSIKISTLSYSDKTISVELDTTSVGNVEVDFYQNEKLLKHCTFNSNKHVEEVVTLSDALLWSSDSPNLVKAKFKFNQDEQIVRFGLRTIELSKEKGLLINGKREILLGACIHHDNGLIGARNIDFAEYRKAKLLKDAGYNAVRSAHNPCSKAFLDACDELGLYVLDEYVDCWYIHKTYYDYVLHMEQNYEHDLKLMSDKDYNHPSVIMYSIGNEVSETGQKKGIELTRKMTEYLHSIDYRYVTCGVNIFFNLLSSMNLGVYSDKKAQKELKSKKKKKAVGSEFFNDLAGIMGASFMKIGATLHGCDVKTRDAFAALDVAGYNYGIKRYKHDLKKYPNRFILGTETFCSDADVFYELAKKNPRLIGDFVWAGIDYIGEVGVGSWTIDEYCDNDFSHSVGWLTAGSGRIDITGKKLSEADFMQVAFDQKVIAIGVVPVNHYKRKHSPSAWKCSMALDNWSYDGFEGKTTEVEVYTKAPFIELYLNGKLLKRKKTKKTLNVFKVKYQPGELKAQAYDKDYNLIDEAIIRSGKSVVTLTGTSELKEFKENDLVYVRFMFSDKNGVVKPAIKDNITIDNVENGTLLGFGNGCSYSKEGYLNNTTSTYYGEVLAIIKPDNKGDVKVNASSKYGDVEVVVKKI